MWVERGILAPDKNGQLKVISNRNAQEQLIKSLKELVIDKTIEAVA